MHRRIVLNPRHIEVAVRRTGQVELLDVFAANDRTHGGGRSGGAGDDDTADP